jgi:hypothetical protein
MRALIVALAMAGAAGAASAGGMGTGITSGEVQQSITPTVPAGARKQAEDAIRHDLRDPAGATFRAVKAIEVASARHGAFGESIDGPISIVCGQYSSQDPKGGYSWFFVALKRGKVLWSASDETSGAPDEAHDSCKGAGLAN